MATRAPRKYGSQPSYREVAYEVLFQNKGRALHVKEIIQRAKRLGMLPGTTPEEAWNTLAAKLNDKNDGRFTRPDKNTFGLAGFKNGGPYEGYYRDMVEEAKEERRKEAAAAGEIVPGRRSPGPEQRAAGDANKVKTLVDSAGQEQCSRDFGPHDAQILRIQSLVHDLLGFEAELKAVALLRSGKFAECMRVLQAERAKSET